MILNSIKLIISLIVIIFFFSSCEEDFKLITDYKDQTVIYAFLEHKDPWGWPSGDTDTNWIVVNKAFLGEDNVEDMASVSDSVNYPNYDDLHVTLQRIKTIDANSATVGEPIILLPTQHYKDSGLFAQDNNIVFYTTALLMNYRNIDNDPSPELDNDYFYKLSVIKPNQEEVYATTKMLRGIYIGKPMTNSPAHREIKMASSFPNYTYKVNYKTNKDARLYSFKIRLFYYEKRTDGHIYLDYVDYAHPVIVTKSKNTPDAQEMKISVSPLSFYSSIERKLHNTDGVVWRAPKILSKTGLVESHALLFTLGDQNTYIYNQVTKPSNGIIQDRPTYTNITNGLGLFSSTWNYQRDQFKLTAATIDSISDGIVTKDLKFLNNSETVLQNSKITSDDVIITQRVLDLR